MENVICEADYVFNNKYKEQTLEIKEGVKIRVNQKNLYLLKSNESVCSQFDLHIKRINRWYWTVEFKANTK